METSLGGKIALVTGCNSGIGRAAAVVWMCSDAASFVTVRTLSVDGGVVAGLTPSH